MRGGVTSIERVERPSVEEFERGYVRAGRPVIIEQAVADWPAMQWTQERIAAEFGDDSLPAEIMAEDRAHDNRYKLANSRLEDVPLRQYLEATDGGSRHYLGQVPLSKLSERMLEDFGTIDHLPRVARNHACFFWLGHARTGSGLHFDYPHNLVVQILGQKRWTVFPRDQCHLVGLPDAELGHFSPIDLDAPDLDRFPGLRDATPIEFTLGPGEILYLPSEWPHHVRAVDFAASLNCFFDMPAGAVR